MKKLIALLLCALVLSACGNTDEKTSDTGTVSSTVSETETAKGKYKKAITTDSAGATVSTTATQNSDNERKFHHNIDR